LNIEHPTSHVVRCSKFSVRRSGLLGFTLLEVLIAMLVAVVLATTTGFALVGTLTVERVAGYAVECEFAAARVATRHYLGLQVGEDDPRFTVVVSEVESKVGDQAFRWTIWTVRSAERPSISSSAALRSP
jgi:prepilin-type N-terminal cleavage/methylation domain-containing protein